jgi:thioester reductase-like protein
MYQRVRGFEGYALSKWCAEKLLEQARSRGLSVSLYRIGTRFFSPLFLQNGKTYVSQQFPAGTVNADTVSGASALEAFINRLIIGVLQVHSAS